MEEAGSEEEEDKGEREDGEEDFMFPSASMTWFRFHGSPVRASQPRASGPAEGAGLPKHLLSGRDLRGPGTAFIIAGSRRFLRKTRRVLEIT
jgi:hypothetical protein